MAMSSCIRNGVRRFLKESSQSVLHKCHRDFPSHAIDACSVFPILQPPSKVVSSHAINANSGVHVNSTPGVFMSGFQHGSHLNFSTSTGNSGDVTHPISQPTCFEERLSQFHCSYRVVDVGRAILNVKNKVSLRNHIQQKSAGKNEVEKEYYARDIFRLLIRSVQYAHDKGFFVGNMCAESCSVNNQHVSIEPIYETGDIVNDIQNLGVVLSSILDYIGISYSWDDELGHLIYCLRNNYFDRADGVFFHPSLCTMGMRKEIVERVWVNFRGHIYDDLAVHCLNQRRSIKNWKSQYLHTIISLRGSHNYNRNYDYNVDETIRSYENTISGLLKFFRNVMVHGHEYRDQLKNTIDCKFDVYTDRYIEYAIRKIHGHIFIDIFRFYEEKNRECLLEIFESFSSEL